MAGHSHSANIAVRKGKQDALRARLFSKLSKDIMIAARDGADPEANFSLRHAIEKAREASMPKDKIEHATKKGAGLLEGVNLTETMMEGYGPGGAAVLLQVLTDNVNRTGPEVRRTFDTHGGKPAGAGAVQWMFKRRGVFLISGEGLSEDAVMERALEVGADDVRVRGGDFLILSSVENFENVKRALAVGVPSPTSSVLGFVADNELELDEETAGKVFRLVNELEKNDDVSAAHTNVRWNAAAIAAWAKIENE
jgi:YebC/PmpR family DNA-binding regulatory protein